MLELLLRSANQPVTRRQIRDCLWGDHTHVDFDDSINYLVRQVRKALGDDAANPQYVETLPRIGYRFVGEVNTEGPTGKGEERASRLTRRWARAAAATLLLFAAAVGVFTWGERLILDDSATIAGVSAKAYGLYLRGRHRLQSDRPEVRESGLAELRSAVALDPHFLEALVQLSNSHAESRQWPDAEIWAERALRVDGSSAEAHLVMALVHMNAHRDWHGAEQHFEGAILNDRADRAAHVLYSIFLSSMARHDEAVALARRALGVETWSQELRANLGQRYFHARRYGEAILEATGILELEPRNAHAHWLIVNSLLLQGKTDLALEKMNAFLEAWGWERFEEASVFWSRTVSNGTYLAPNLWAWVYLQQGKRERALDVLHQASCGGESEDIRLLLVGVDPRLDDLRGDPAFNEVLTCLGLS